MSDKIRPGGSQIGGDEHLLRLQAELEWRHHVLIHRVDGAKIAQMPIEFRTALFDAGGDCGQRHQPHAEHDRRAAELPGQARTSGVDLGRGRPG